MVGGGGEREGAGREVRIGAGKEQLSRHPSTHLRWSCITLHKYMLALMTTGSLVSSTWWLEGEGLFISHTHWSSSWHSHDEALDHILAHFHLHRVLL